VDDDFRSRLVKQQIWLACGGREGDPEKGSSGGEDPAGPELENGAEAPARE